MSAASLTVVEDWVKGMPASVPQCLSLISPVANSFLDPDHIHGWTVFVSWLLTIFCHVSLTQSVTTKTSYKKPGMDEPGTT